ncbi:MAG TPA: DUF4468 domain-containing protein [Bacteroidales bacterium]|nr:DUF4468 domain-containing protein [Bacteroidales bacterium]
MKSKILILIIIIFPFIGFSQTEELEKENFNKKIAESNTYSSEELMQYGKEWNKLMDQEGGYPELPYDTNTNELVYKIVTDFDELNTEIIFNRIIEWASIAVYNPDDVIVYQNRETGKIILKGTVHIDYAYDKTNFWGIDKEKKNYTRCAITIICTVSNNKLKMEIRDLRYIYMESYLGSYGFRHNEFFEKPVNMLYPITDFPVNKWGEYLQLLIATNNEMKSLQSDMVSYIDDYFNDYDY